MLPLILAFGITLGVRFGARLGLSHYLTMTAYTGALVLVWWTFYTFVLVRRVGRRPVGPVLSGYYLPTAVFAAGTCSSLATLPVNLANAKGVGVRDEVADFVLPFGAVVNLDASALAYLAYGPFVVSHVFGLELSWMMMLAAWPAVVLFTIAAPGLPAGMGTALWSATLFASILGLDGPAQGEFIASWIALSGRHPRHAAHRDQLYRATATPRSSSMADSTSSSGGNVAERMRGSPQRRRVRSRAVADGSGRGCRGGGCG